MSELSAPHTKSRNFCLPIQRQLNPSTIRFARVATYAVFFGDGLGFGVWAGHIAIFKQEFHLTDAQLSVALFAVALGSIFSMPIVGQSLTRFGSRPLTGLCASLYAIVIACLARAPTYPLFVLGTALFGACKGGLDVSVNAQAVGVESAYGRPIMSSFQAAWSVGGLAGAALAAAALHSGFVAEQNLAAAAALILAITFLSVRYLIPEKARGQAKSLAWPDKALLSVAAFTFLALSNLVPIFFGSAGRHKAGAGPGIAAVTTIGFFGFLVGPPVVGTLGSLLSLPAALSLVIVFGLIIANSARHAVAGP